MQCGNANENANENANFSHRQTRRRFSYYALKMSSYIHYHFDAHLKMREREIFTQKHILFHSFLIKGERFGGSELKLIMKVLKAQKISITV